MLLGHGKACVDAATPVQVRIETSPWVVQTGENESVGQGPQSEKVQAQPPPVPLPVEPA